MSLHFLCSSLSSLVRLYHFLDIYLNVYFCVWIIAVCLEFLPMFCESTFLIYSRLELVYIKQRIYVPVHSECLWRDVKAALNGLQEILSSLILTKDSEEIRNWMKLVLQRIKISIPSKSKKSTKGCLSNTYLVVTRILYTYNINIIIILNIFL